MSNLIVAIDTYGRQRIKSPNSDALVSAYKLGYTTAGAAVLLALYGERAQNLSSSRTSYHYVSISGETSIHNGYLLFAISQNELAKVEAITRQHSDHSGCWRWQEGQWLTFPTANHPEYLAAGNGREGPNFKPSGFRPVFPQTGRKEVAAEGIRAERSQPSPSDKVWWWLSGETYPHRELLNRYGCHWAKRRRAWYYVGSELPQAIQDLLSGWGDEQAEQKAGLDEPCSIAEASKTLGITPDTKSNAELVPDLRYRFQEGEMVFLCEGLRSGNGQQLKEGQEGRVSARHNRDLQYLVQFEEGAEDWIPEKQLSRFRPSHLHRFELGQRVYLKTSLRVTKEIKLKMDTAGAVVKRYKYQKHPDFRYQLAYTIDFGEKGSWHLFEDSLDAEPQNLPGIERHETVMVRFGVSADKAIEFEIERRQQIPENYEIQDVLSASAPCPCEAFGTKGWYPAPKQVDWVKCGLCNPDGLNKPAILPDGSNKSSDIRETVQAIRIIRPDFDSSKPEYSLVQETLKTLTTENFKTSVAVNRSSPKARNKLESIPQEYVGRLTGSVDADVHCYGFALDEGICIYLNMAGPRSGTEAIRAKLGKGDIVNLSPWEGPSIELTAGEGNTGKYEAHLNYLKEVRFASCILLHETVTRPNYNGNAHSYILQISEEQAKAQLYTHIQQLLNIAVFQEWTDYLWKAGQAAMLLRLCRGGGGLKVLSLHLDRTAWTRLLTGALEAQILSLPEKSG